MTQLYLAILLAMLLHLAAMALVARSLGMTVRWVAFGIGPIVFQRPGFRLGALPLGGHVRLLHSVEDALPESQWSMAMDKRPVQQQLAVTLAGCAVLLAAALVLGGKTGLEAFLSFPAQLLTGVLSPFQGAQTLLRDAAAWAQSAPLSR